MHPTTLDNLLAPLEINSKAGTVDYCYTREAYESNDFLVTITIF